MTMDKEKNGGLLRKIKNDIAKASALVPRTQNELLRKRECCASRKKIYKRLHIKSEKLTIFNEWQGDE